MSTDENEIERKNAEIEKMKRKVELLQKKLSQEQQVNKKLQSKIHNLNLEKRRSLARANRRIAYQNKVIENIVNNAKNLSKRSERKLVLNVIKTSCQSLRAPDRRVSAYKTLYKKIERKNNKKPPKPTKKQEYGKLAKQIKEFYLNDSNSIPAPGLKDYITRQNIKKRKRFLCDTVFNLFKKFRSEINVKVKKTFFYRLKPFWVVKRKVTQRDTCLCKQHVNFTNIYKVLRENGVIQQKDYPDFLASTCCDIKSKQCMFGEHSACRGWKTLIPEHIDKNKLIRCHYWEGEQLDRINAKGESKTSKPLTEKTLSFSIKDMVEKFDEELIKFKMHFFITDHQFKTLDVLRKNLQNHEAYLIVDWSQNYLGKKYKEVHAFHFGQNQRHISLQVGGYYINLKNSKTNEIETQFVSFATVSDVLRHESEAVWAHLIPVLDNLKRCYPEISTIHFQSDGPTTQYKNKKHFYLFHKYCRKLELEVSSWNYTSPGHGKSVADGIGGTIKELCNRVVTYGGNVTTAQEMYDVISERSSIQPFLISASNIGAIANSLPKDLKGVEETRKFFQIYYSKKHTEKLYFRSLSCHQCKDQCKHFDLAKSVTNFI